MTSGVHNFQELRPRIVVMGVGGAGGNAVNNMIASGLEGVEFVAANTDAQALSMSGADVRFQLGVNLTEGLGAGSNPEIGEGAAEEVLEEMRELLTGAHMVFVACGMGGGTGTGAAPVVARVAKELGVLTVAVVTKPFHFEGQRRMRVAEAGIEQLRDYVDTMIVIPNQNLFRLATEQTTFADSFRLADQVLNSGVSCVTDLIMKEGLINLDFADVKTVITEMGAAVMGTGYAHGEGRAVKAAEEAISNPLIDDISLTGAKGLLISISGGMDMTLFEVDEVASRIRREVDPDANIIVGATFDENLQGHLRVSLVASGLNHAHPKSMHEEADRRRMEQDQRDEMAGLAPHQPSGLNERLKQVEAPERRGDSAGARGQDQALRGDRAGGDYQRGGEPHLRGGVGPHDAPDMPGKGQVRIKNKPPRFMSDDYGRGGAADAGPQGELPDGRVFQPGAPQAVQQPLRRMPRVDELPVTGQKQIMAYETERPASGLEAQKKKVGFFERLTGRHKSTDEDRHPEAGEGDLEARDDRAAPGALTDAHGRAVPPPQPTRQPLRQEGQLERHHGGGEDQPESFRPERPSHAEHPQGRYPQAGYQNRRAEMEGGAEPLKERAPDRQAEEGGMRRDEHQNYEEKGAGERYPTYEVRKPPLPPIDLEEDDDMPVDIPPFLKKGQK